MSLLRALSLLARGPVADPPTRVIVPPPPRGLRADASDFGAAPGRDCSGSLQSAVDSLVRGGVVTIPASVDPYTLERPVFVPVGVAVAGEGSLRTRLSCPNGGGLLLSCDRWRPDAGYRPDAKGAYDPSVTGRRWAVRLNGDTYLQFEGVAPAVGPNGGWRTRDQLTIEAHLSTGDGKPLPPDAPLFGVGTDRGGEAAPVAVYTWDVPGRVVVFFRTSDQSPGETTNELDSRFFSFDLPPAQPWELVIQIDLRTATAMVICNGKPLPVTGQRNATPATWKPGLTFAPNDHYPLTVGASPLRTGTAADLVIAGMRWSDVVRYGPDGRRLDGGPVTHASKYFTDDAHTLAFLPLTDAPGDSNLVSLWSGAASDSPGLAYGLMTHASYALGGDNTVRGLTLVGRRGQGVGIGAGTGFRLDDITALDFTQGVGSVHGGATYPVTLTDCALAGRDSGLCLYRTLATSERLSFPTPGRVASILVGSSLDARHVFVGRGNPGTEGVLKYRCGDYAGSVSLSNVEVDFEGETVAPWGALFSMEREGDAARPSLWLRDVKTGTAGAVPVVRLLDVAPASNTSYSPAYLSVDGLTVGDKTAVAVEVDGPSWRGEVRGLVGGARSLTTRGRFGDKTAVSVVPAPAAKPVIGLEGGGPP